MSLFVGDGTDQDFNADEDAGGRRQMEYGRQSSAQQILVVLVQAVNGQGLSQHHQDESQGGKSHFSPGVICGIRHCGIKTATGLSMLNYLEVMLKLTEAVLVKVVYHLI